MARALRFDSVRVNADGSVAVEYTYGSMPLPVNPSGKGLLFPSRQAVVSLKNDALSEFNENMLLELAIAVYALATGDQNLSDLDRIIGKTLTVDPTRPNAIMSFA